MRTSPAMSKSPKRPFRLADVHKFIRADRFETSSGQHHIAITKHKGGG